ncbi:MAG: gliding motility-associated ABC transporter substrate-binding protein GldG [Sphingobacteriales bacterium]|nr:MAG: gliding motility-associated ABC transporter substrate-binding protein GldG [Sphingobacteriales bacterium]
MSTNTSKKRKSQQKQAVLRIIVLAAILVCVNMLAARLHYGLDLTKEKRFTLSPATVKLLRNMDDVAVVDVYLKGKFPAGFQRLSESTRERLQSFREYAGNKIIVRFTDPFEGKSEEEKGPIYEQLAKKGISPVNMQVKGDDEGYQQKIIFPYALVQYKGKEMPVRLLENSLALSPLEALNYSESLLEYKFANAINKLTSPQKPELAYIMGHGENLGMQTFDLLTSLRGPYVVDTLDLVSSLYIPNYYKAIIINKPTMPFDDKDKFKIDQYIMNGGHVLWAVESLRASMDSLQTGSQQFIATDYGLNLDDQLFKYGVRINGDLIEDLQCLQIPVIDGQVNNNPQMVLKSWMYYPLFLPSSSHPIVKNMDAISSMFANSIDTVNNPEIRKTILLQSSKYSRVAPAPVRVSLSMMKYQPRAELFNNPNKAAAVLLEGKFRSVFQNRLSGEFLSIMKDSLKREFKGESDTATSMIVISDGDMMSNDFTQRMGPMEMGFWRFTNEKYANKNFVLNCLEYLTDHSGLLEARSKDVRLRVMDGGRVKEEKGMWQAINIGLPIALVLIFASCYLFFRKRRYEKR